MSHLSLSPSGLFTGIGLGHLAERMYYALLYQGPATVAELAHRTDQYRPAIYRELPTLTKHGLITSMKKGRRNLYMAQSPAALSALAKERLTSIEEHLPELLKVFSSNENKPKMSFFEGKEGIKTVYEQLLQSTRKGGHLYRYESPKDYKKNKEYYPSMYRTRAGNTGDLDKYVITNTKTHSVRHERLNRYSKAVDVPFEENITEIIAGGKVVFIDYDTETAIMIENERFMNFQKSLFKILYGKL